MSKFEDIRMSKLASFKCSYFGKYQKLNLSELLETKKMSEYSNMKKTLETGKHTSDWILYMFFR